MSYLGQEITDTESIISQHLHEQPPSQYAGELEVELIIQDKDDIAKETLTTEDIKMLYLSGKLKYRMHENCAIDEDQLRLMLSKGKIKEDRNNLILLDSDTFRKTRNGKGKSPTNKYSLTKHKRTENKNT